MMGPNVSYKNTASGKGFAQIAAGGSLEGSGTANVEQQLLIPEISSALVSVKMEKSDSNGTFTIKGKLSDKTVHFEAPQFSIQLKPVTYVASVAGRTISSPVGGGTADQTYLGLSAFDLPAAGGIKEFPLAVGPGSGFTLIVVELVTPQ
jgi:hypothetical protein